MYFEDLTSQYDLNIYLDLEESIKEQSKISRDLERGKTEDIIKKEIENRKSDYKKYIETQAEFADVYIKTLEMKLLDSFYLSSSKIFHFCIIIKKFFYFL